MKRAGVYVRVSVDRDGESESPERQRRDCEDLARRKGLEVVQVYEDRDASAFRRSTSRPAYERLLADARSGKLDAIVFWKLDRMTRQGIRGLVPLLDLGVSLVSVNEDLDTTTASGELLAGVLASIAKQESENTSVRVTRAHRSAAEAGKMHSGGARGYGYTRAAVIVPAEAEIIRESARRILDGESWHAVTKDLNARGVPSAGGGKWHPRSLANLLRSPRLAGIRVHRGETYQGEWEPILTVADHEALVATRSTSNFYRRPYHLLGGVIYCSECGGRMKVKSTGKPYEKYLCVPSPGRINCGRVAIAKKSTDVFIRDELFRLLTAGEIVPANEPEKLDAVRLRKLIAEDRDALNDLARDRYSRRLIGHEEYVAARSEIDVRLAGLEADLARLEDEERAAEASKALRPGRLEDLVAWWEGATDGERREAVHGAIERVTVHPATTRGNRIDTSRIVVAWRMSFLSRVGVRVLEDASPDEIAAAEDEYARLNREAAAS